MAISCKNVACLHYSSSEKKCKKKKVSIGETGKCESFEKGAAYYFFRVFNILDSTNFIDQFSLTDDIRVGIHFIMRAFGLGLTVRDWGSCRMYLLTDESGNGLNHSQIVKREINMDELQAIIEEVDSGNLPKIKKIAPKKTSQPFGWLSPAGDFFEGDFAEHEEIAFKIIKKKGFQPEFDQWIQSLSGRTARDFLSQEKGYCLIHNPMGDGGYIVSRTKPFTKQQKDFLYGYFMDIGDRMRAESFLKDE